MDNAIKLIIKTRSLYLEKTKLWNNQTYIGYSHLNSIGASFNDHSITKKEALILLKKDVIKITKQLKKHLRVELNHNQFDALISLVYDIGIKRFITDEMFMLINKNDFIAASLHFNKFNKYLKKPIYKLIKARKEEQKLWNKPINEK